MLKNSSQYMHKWHHLEFFVNNTDILIINAGIHLLANGRKFDEVGDVAAAKQLAANLRSISHRSWAPRTTFPLVIWRETTHSQLGSTDVIKRMNRCFSHIRYARFPWFGSVCCNGDWHEGKVYAWKVGGL